MPIHDWTRVLPGIFHSFRLGWIADLSRALNTVVLPPSYYAMIEKRFEDRPPEVGVEAASEHPSARLVENGELITESSDRAATAISVREHPPKMRRYTMSETVHYARKADRIAVRRTSNHTLVAVIEVVSPGNKSGSQVLSKFVEKAANLLEAGVHLLVIDLFPPGSFNPNGIHAAIWENYTGEHADPSPGRPLTLASYIGGGAYEAYIEPTAVGTVLIDMPLFLNRDSYVPVPLEPTYQSAWEAVPAFWRRKIAGDEKRS